MAASRGVGFEAALGDDLFHNLCICHGRIRECLRAAVVGVGQIVMSWAELMEYGCMQIIYAYTVFDSPISNVVG